MVKIGFIGLGIMGKPMSKNLIKAGYKLVVYDLNETAVEELVSLGSVKALSPATVAGDCETVITMLPDSPQVKEVVSGKDGLIYGFRAWFRSYRHEFHLSYCKQGIISCS